MATAHLVNARRVYINKRTDAERVRGKGCYGEEPIPQATPSMAPDHCSRADAGNPTCGCPACHGGASRRWRHHDSAPHAEPFLYCADAHRTDGGGQRYGGVRANSFGTNSTPTPSWELPKYLTPHWELGPTLQRPPNPVHGNRIPRRGAGFGVGYVGFPYYVDPFSFGNAWDWNDDSDSEAQAAPAARPEYAQQQPEPYAEAPYDQGYPPPPPPGYDQEGFPMRAQDIAAQNNAAQNDGLDHPPVTLVFNNGRPPEKVSSYVLTGSSIFVAEPGHQRKIPIADLDLPATIEQNREAGVDFELPGGSR